MLFNSSHHVFIDDALRPIEEAYKRFYLDHPFLSLNKPLYLESIKAELPEVDLTHSSDLLSNDIL